MCHLNVIELRSTEIICAACGAQRRDEIDRLAAAFADYDRTITPRHA